MKKRIWTRVLSAVLSLALCTAVLPAAGAKAANVEAEVNAGSSAVVEKNADNAAIDALLNKQTLHPQKTGYAALDRMLEEILGPYANKSVAEQVKACYDWTVREINYSWSGYNRGASAGLNTGYKNFNYVKNAYPFDDYDKDLQKAIPDEMIARTYYTMTKHEGVCYDWGVVMAVMVRYVGLDAYVHTGDYKFESSVPEGWNGAHGHHGWTEITLDGKNYIFDPQREFRMCNNGKGTINYTRYFGVTNGSTNYFRYTPDTKANAERDAGFLSVSAHRAHAVSVSAVSSRSGYVTGTGRYFTQQIATLNAVPSYGKTFSGWYDADGKFLTSDTTYSFTIEDATTVYAMFEGDMFYDLKNQWYVDNAMKATQKNLISGTAPFKFDGDVPMTRGMVVLMLAKADGANLDGYITNQFDDVAYGQWFSNAVAWAYDHSIVKGTSENTFDPNKAITREEFMTMAISYLNYKNIDVPAAQLDYSDADQINSWAYEAVQKAQGAGLTSGYPDKTFRPKNSLTRAEGATIILNLIDFAAASAA